MGKNNKKNYPKAYIKLSNGMICVDELVQAVNECDKRYGIRLKHPDIWSEPEQYLHVVEAKCDMITAAIICVLNGIPIDDYFETDTETGYGTICKPIGNRHSCFTEQSHLNWHDEKTKYETNSLMFRCRFATLVLSQFLGRYDLITGREVVSRYRYKHSLAERKILVSKDEINYILRFVLIMISLDTKYENIILKMHEYMSYTKKNVEHRKLRSLLNGHILSVRKGMQSNIISDRFMTDDLAIYNIMKISYMLATNKTNLDVLPNFKHIDGATVEHDLIMLIEELGVQIIQNSRDRKYSPMFKAFLEARPIIWSQFYKESRENYAIQMGLIALAYAKFVFDDDEIGDFIDDMMKKGI